MIKFDSDENLGSVISNRSIFSQIGVSPIKDKFQLTIAGGRHKMSRLCGFVFTSSVKKDEKFAIVFVCKLRSKINHQQKKQVGGQWTIPSRWFGMTQSARNQYEILSKETLFDNFQFDVDKFFKSDLFNTECKKLQKVVKSGLKQAMEFAQSLDDKMEQRLAIEEVNAIELSIPLMSEDRYEDKNYNLIDYNMKEKEELKEADDREPLSHALDVVGVKASTANTADQDAVEMSLVEKEIDDDIEEAMKEIYGEDAEQNEEHVEEADNSSPFEDNNRENFKMLKTSLKKFIDTMKLDFDVQSDDEALALAMTAIAQQLVDNGSDARMKDIGKKVIEIASDY